MKNAFLYNVNGMESVKNFMELCCDSRLEYFERYRNSLGIRVSEHVFFLYKAPAFLSILQIFY